MRATPLPLDRATVERLSVGRGEPGWMLEDRLGALERFENATFPSGQEEEWRRFPLKDLPAVSPSELLDVSHPPSEYGSVPLEASHKGLVFDRWSSAVRDHPDLVRRSLPDGGGMPSHAAFRAWAGALYGHGSTFLYVPAGLHVELPLEVHKHWAAGSAPIVFRTLVIAEEGSSVTLLEELSSDGGGPGRIAVPSVEIRAGPGATVRYIGVQRYGDDVWEIGQQRSISERDSMLANFNVLVGSKRTKLGVESDIRGNGAQVKLYGLVAAGDHQRIDVNSLQRLDGKASTSDLLYLSALYEAAHAVFYGVIRVEPTSSMTGSYQECRNMLLSKKAGADPIPVLEILTNDVARCGHGATAGSLSDEDLFYVMSRGLDRATAEQLLVRGFFQRVVNDIPDVQIRARVTDALAPRIGRISEADGVAA